MHTVYYLYILFSQKSNIYYVGYSTDFHRRLEEHNTSLRITFSSKHRPWILAAAFECATTEAEAMKIERFIKRQKSKTLILSLINENYQPTRALAQLVRVPHVRD